MYLQNIFQQNQNPRHNVVATYQNLLGSCNNIFLWRCKFSLSLGEKVFLLYSYKKYQNAYSLNFSLLKLHD